MTPDELRRMDPNTCIILERGVKPIKASKYYYYEDKIYLQQLKDTAIDHNNYECSEKGNYRVFNPNNPYVDKKLEIENTKIDDLIFGIDDDKSNKQHDIAIPTGIEAVGGIASSDDQKSKGDEFDLSDIDIGEELRNKYSELFSDDDNNF